ncbi:unnamed protein product [Macrosiphum euphorbiae]|uniref:DNA replication licensing factor MCM4-like n=1 Tax=Macrosiphum euphorbiae TaxID=13131 RepID=A0AAV0W2F6_9HEMI|nr:unnamed protein product [Macrosiphum euphorbiae]
MNKNPTGTTPKNSTTNRSHTPISNPTISTLKTKINKPPQKTASIQQSTKNIVVQGTDRNIGVPSTLTSNHTSRIAIKNPLLLSATTTPSSDNNRAADTIAKHTNNNISTNDLPIISSSNKTDNNNINFASAVAMEKNPSREQALVFNTIDGIPQKDYVLAIGKIVSPKNITFISRISNNRFCIFLSSKQILDNLFQKTQSININDQTIPIRRLLNPAKRYIISNVCPSIPNQAITNALNGLDIFPISQISHLKAGINIEGFEHIMSFRRQLYIKHEDIPKLPNSLVITTNESQFRIFFTDDIVTCFICKASGHTSSNCKNINATQRKNSSSSPNKPDEYAIDHTELIENIRSPTSPTLDILDQTKSDLTEDLEETKFFPLTQNHFDEALFHSPIETQKRLMSDSSSSKPPDSPNALLPSTLVKKNEKTIKKPKIQSRSNSSNSLDINLDEKLNPIIEYYTVNEHLPITYIQFKYILDNFNNKSINIHTLIEDINTSIPTLMDIIEHIHPKIKDKSLKSRITKLRNLLFQSQPLQQSSIQN